MDITRDELWGLGVMSGKKVGGSFWGGLTSGASFGVAGIGLVAYQASRSNRGGFVPAIVGQVGAIGVGSILAGVAASGFALIPGIGIAAASVLGALLADYPEYAIGTWMGRKVRLFTDVNKKIRHLEMGGSYQDSQLAHRQRFIALQDMSSAMIPARRYLGQEALLMHR